MGSRELEILVRSVERESLEFERRVIGQPFLPLSGRHPPFVSLCADVAALLGCKVNDTSLEHVIWMARIQAGKEDGGRFTMGEDGPEWNTLRAPDGSIVSLVARALNSKYGMIDPAALGMTPRYRPRGYCVLLSYIVRADKEIEDLLGEHPAADCLTILESANIDWRTRFLCCEVRVVTEECAGVQEVVETLRSLFSDKFPPVAFHSHHLIVGLPSQVELGDWTRIALRARELQFQREWGDRTIERLRQERARRDGLVTLNHEFKNVLASSGWEKLLWDIEDPRANVDESGLRERVTFMLHHMIWLSSLVHAVRALSKMDNGVQLRETWLDPGTGVEIGVDIAVWRNSVEYLAGYIASTCEFGCPNLVFLDVAEEPRSPAVLATLAGRACQPSRTVFAPDRLAFPPLRTEMDDYAPLFTFMSFLAEPIRNAVTYVSKTFRHDPEALVAIHLAPRSGHSPGVDLTVINPIVAIPAGPIPKSLKVLEQLGRSLGLASPCRIEVLPTDRSLFAVVTIALTPSNLGNSQESNQ